MDFHDNEHVYKVIPPVLGNENAEKPAIFHLKGISQDDMSEAIRYQASLSTKYDKDRATEERAKSAAKLVGDRVVKIENLTAGGKDITTYEEMTKHCPRSLVDWVVAAVHTTETLMGREIKN